MRFQDEYLALDGSDDDPYPDGRNLPGVRVDCESCHIQEARAYADWVDETGGSGMGDVACVDCHMPNIAKSGHAAGTFAGDVAGHLIGIDVMADFTSDPSASTAATNPANPYVSLDWACGGCHADLAEDEDFDFYGWAYSRSVGIHGGDAEESEATYVGMDACSGCHEEYVLNVEASAHPYKIVPVDEVLDGTAYPDFVQMMRGEEFAVDVDFFSDQSGVLSINSDTFPLGGWADVSYVIGGYGWKARFIGTDGYIITGEAGDLVQYNPPFDPGFFGAAAYPGREVGSSTYHSGELKPYTCGTCHTTGWVADTDAATDGTLADNQDGLEGCHGPGSDHAADPEWNRLPTPAGNEMCGTCHTRGSDWTDIDISGGYIKHHEQYEEMTASGHFDLGCQACHDPHRPVRFADAFIDADGEAYDPVPGYDNIDGIHTDCVDCHADVAAAYDEGPYAAFMGGVECIDCHMPYATKSASAVAERAGDVRTHIFGIDITADIDADLSLHTAGADGGDANRYVSIDWACTGCHSDEFGTANDAGIFEWATGVFDSIGLPH